MTRLIALLARRDGNMDGVTEYCNSLRRELPNHGLEVQLARVPWDQIGWPRALWADIPRGFRRPSGWS